MAYRLAIVAPRAACLGRRRIGRWCGIVICPLSLPFLKLARRQLKRPCGDEKGSAMNFVTLRQNQMKRQELAGEVVTQLVTFEEDLGRALASGSRLIGYLPAARSQANISAVVGQDAISHFVASLGLISQAMGAVVDGHHSLDEVRCTLRIPEVAGGDKDVLPSVNLVEDQGAGVLTTTIAG